VCHAIGWCVARGDEREGRGGEEAGSEGTVAVRENL
jgi:hypothetical protein